MNPKIEWGTLESPVFLNPRLPEALLQGLREATFPRLPSHVWVASSGSNSELTLYALSKSALLISAEAVNKLLVATRKDIWLKMLPNFHVGGIGIQARGFLNQARVVDRANDSWAPDKFHQVVNEEQVTLSALVPTQIFDLVKFGLKSPPSLRAVIVGGAAIDEELYLRARAMGFPLLPSYGMTECCSQVATAPLDSLSRHSGPSLEALSHVELKTVEGRIAVKSPSLFTAKATWNSKSRNLEVLWRAGEWYVTADRGEVFNQIVIVRGRDRDEIKISGELVSLNPLRAEFKKIVSESHAQPEFHIFSAPHARRGAEIALAIDIASWPQVEEWVQVFNTAVLPVAKIRAVYGIRHFPRTELGKIKEVELHRMLNL